MLNQQQSFVIQNFTNCGIAVNESGSGTRDLQLVGLSFVSNAIGIHAIKCQPNDFQHGGYPNTIQACNFQDSSNAAVYVDPNPPLTAVSIDLCWFHNSLAPQANMRQAGVVGGVGINQCVFGPQLNYGLLVPDNLQAFVSNSLFLDAYKSNVTLGTPLLGNNGYQFTSLNNVTAVSTPLNPNLVGHNTIDAGVALVGQSIFFGARVKAPAGSKFYLNPNGPPNEQYHVTGNTTALATTLTDPQFIDQSIYTFPNTVSPNTLINTDYSTKNPSYGSSVTSVAKLLQLQSQ